MASFTAQTLRAFVPLVNRPYESALIYPAVFSPRQCARIVALGSRLGADTALIGAAEDEVEEQAVSRRARTAWIAPGELTLWIFDKLTKVAQRANRVYAFDLLGFTEEAQFTIYDEPGAFYDWHQDGLAGEVAVRKLSLVVQLSDPADYEGGDLEFFNVVHEQGEPFAAEWVAQARQRGGVIVFPAFEYHRVQPLLSGSRYSLVCWIGGPPFK